MTLAVVRHGTTAWNRDRRMQGTTDLQLDDVGRAEARAAAARVARLGATRIVTSPMVRARETATIIAAALGLEGGVSCDAELVERDFGVAEGLPVDEARERWPDAVYPEAEPMADVAARGARALARVSGEPTIVVAHGVLLRATLELVTGAPVARLVNGEALVLRDGRLERTRTDDARGGTMLAQ